MDKKSDEQLIWEKYIENDNQKYITGLESLYQQIPTLLPKEDKNDFFSDGYDYDIVKYTIDNAINSVKIENQLINMDEHTYLKWMDDKTLTQILDEFDYTDIHEFLNAVRESKHPFRNGLIKLGLAYRYMEI